MIDNVREWYRQLPDKKKYLEFVSALLTVPVLITVILINLNNLSQKNNAGKNTEAPVPAVTKIVETLQPVNMMESKGSSSAPASSSAITATPAECKKQVGPVSIVSPQENEVISGDSVCLNINYQQDGYCNIVWSYSLDNSSWSSYSSENVCLYNISPGTHVLNLRVKSAVSDNQVMLRRTFIYGNPTPFLSPTQSASAGATTQ